MKSPTPSISLFVKSQFPDFYSKDGETFTTFVQAYYEWLGEKNNVGELTSNIYNLRDIDLTIDDFVLYFKNKYLVNFKANPETDLRRMVKRAVELFGTKGTEQSIKLLFRLLYGQEVEVYYPGIDVLRCDDGKWFQAKYLEVSPTQKIKEYLYRKITGATSGATAFVEGVVRKSVSSRQIDVVYISNIKGQFQSGERITATGDLRGAPIVFGSMIDVIIDNGGANNSIGDIMTIKNNDGSGIGGKVRITELENATGRVSFALVEGGYGYRMSSNVIVSDNMFMVSNVSSANFSDYEIVQQRTQRIGYISANGTPNTSVELRGFNANSVQVANGIVVSVNSSAIVVDTINGNFANSATIQIPNTFSAVVSSSTNTFANATFVKYIANTNRLGVTSSNGTFYAGGRLNFLTSNVTAKIATIYTGNNATAKIGALADTESIFLYTDMLAANNVDGIPFMNIILSGSNANNRYAFPKVSTGYSANIDTVIDRALDFGVFTIGSIGSLTGIDPGENYNANPFIQIYDPLIVGFDRKPVICEISNTTSAFIIGEDVTQTVLADSYTIQIANTTGTFANGEGVLQANSNAKGVISSVNTTHIIVSSENTRPFFAGNNTLTGSSSGATGKATTNTLFQTNVVSRGEVLNSTISSVTIKPKSFNYVISPNRTVIGTLSGATGVVTSFQYDMNYRAMGDNSIVSANVVTANGVTKTISVIDSGFGWKEGESIQLFSEGNPYVTTGTIVSNQHGASEGFWRNNDGKIDSDKYLHDNHYYQEFSYEIQTGLSLGVYQDMLKQSFHLAGTALFGKVVKVSEIDQTLSVDSEVVEE